MYERLHSRVRTLLQVVGSTLVLALEYAYELVICIIYTTSRTRVRARIYFEHYVILHKLRARSSCYSSSTGARDLANLCISFQLPTACRGPSQNSVTPWGLGVELDSWLANLP